MRFLAMMAVFFMGSAAALRAETPAAPTPVPETLPAPTTQPDGGGEILFFPELKERPVESRHPVQSGQTVSVCVKIFPRDRAFFRRLLERSIGFRLIMEDQKDPPNEMTAVIGNRLRFLTPDAQGCLNGDFQIPPQTPSGRYQVADFLIAENDQSYYSLRENLYTFTLADELQILNPDQDAEAPQLTAIKSFAKPVNRMKSHSDVIKIRLDQIFSFSDNSGKIDPASLKAYYRLWVDDQLVALKLADCRRTRPHSRFHCTLRLANPKVEWGLREVALELQSLQVKDRSGNELFLDDPAVFKEKSGGQEMKFVYRALKPWPDKSANDLDRQSID